MWVVLQGPSGTFWRRLRRQVEAARADAVPVLAVRRVWLMFRPRLARDSAGSALKTA